jgi:hypothetical protein
MKLYVHEFGFRNIYVGTERRGVCSFWQNTRSGRGQCAPPLVCRGSYWQPGKNNNALSIFLKIIPNSEICIIHIFTQILVSNQYFVETWISIFHLYFNVETQPFAGFFCKSLAKAKMNFSKSIKRFFVPGSRLTGRRSVSRRLDSLGDNHHLKIFTYIKRDLLFIGLIHFSYFFWRARVCWPLRCLCRPFCIFERCLDSNWESCRSHQSPPT